MLTNRKTTVTPPNNRRKQKGGTLVDCLVGSLLMCIAVMVLVQVWAFSFRVTINSDDLAIAYNLGRQGMELVKLNDFATVPEGTTIAYYDGSEGLRVSSAYPSRYSVTTSVISSAVSSGTAGQAGAVPVNTALRTVKISVILLDTSSKLLYQTSTYMAKGGV